MALYRRFLESPNFSAWFERQRAAAWGWQAAEWAAAAAARGEGADLRGLDEVTVCQCQDGTCSDQPASVHAAGRCFTCATADDVLASMRPSGRQHICSQETQIVSGYPCELLRAWTAGADCGGLFRAGAHP